MSGFEPGATYEPRPARPLHELQQVISRLLHARRLRRLWRLLGLVVARLVCQPCMGGAAGDGSRATTPVVCELSVRSERLGLDLKGLGFRHKASNALSAQAKLALGR